MTHPTTGTPILEAQGLTRSFGSRRDATRAVDDVSFSVGAGAILGIVGESGSGKSTTLRCVVGLERADAGQVLFDGVPLAGANRQTQRRFSTFTARRRPSAPCPGHHVRAARSLTIATGSESARSRSSKRRPSRSGMPIVSK